METSMLTIAEAAEKTGRSGSTIRRIIHTITEASSHPDRTGIVPTVKQVEAFKKKGENFTWKIREDLLMKHTERALKEAKKPSTGREEIVYMLQRELTLKNQQIEKQFEVIQSLNERIREGNILMGSLQQHLALPQAAAAKTPAAAAAAAPSSAKPSATASAKRKHKGFFHWLRG